MKTEGIPYAITFTSDYPDTYYIWVSIISTKIDMVCTMVNEKDGNEKN